MAQSVDVVVSEREREVLEWWARRPKSCQALAFRCRGCVGGGGGSVGNLPRRTPQLLHPQLATHSVQNRRVRLRGMHIQTDEGLTLPRHGRFLCSCGATRP